MAGDERLVPDEAPGHFRGLYAETVALQARYADLAILGQRNPTDTSLAAVSDVVGTTLLSSGRPVLVLPYLGDFSAVGRNILAGWKSTREAARAINDAMPLLQRADTVTVLAINPEHGIGGDGDVPASDMISRSISPDMASKRLLPIRSQRRFRRAMRFLTTPATTGLTSSLPADTVTRGCEN